MVLSLLKAQQMCWFFAKRLPLVVLGNLLTVLTTCNTLKTLGVNSTQLLVYHWPSEWFCRKLFAIFSRDRNASICPGYYIHLDRDLGNRIAHALWLGRVALLTLSPVNQNNGSQSRGGRWSHLCGRGRIVRSSVMLHKQQFKAICPSRTLQYCLNVFVYSLEFPCLL